MAQPESYRAIYTYAWDLVDEGFAAVGTANMDSRSFHLNYEVIVALYGPEAARELASAFARDLERSHEVTQGALANDRLWRRIGEACARLLAPVL